MMGPESHPHKGSCSVPETCNAGRTALPRVRPSTLLCSLKDFCISHHLDMELPDSPGLASILPPKPPTTTHLSLSIVAGLSVLLMVATSPIVELLFTLATQEHAPRFSVCFQKHLSHRQIYKIGLDSTSFWEHVFVVVYIIFEMGSHCVAWVVLEQILFPQVLRLQAKGTNGWHKAFCFLLYHLSKLQYPHKC